MDALAKLVEAKRAKNKDLLQGRKFIKRVDREDAELKAANAGPAPKVSALSGPLHRGFNFVTSHSQRQHRAVLVRNLSPARQASMQPWAQDL
jgi:hypothetical protein